MADARPRVLAVLPGFFPSTIIGVAKPLLRLHVQGRIRLDLTLQFLVGRHAVERADVVVLCREINPKFVHILDWAKELGRPLVYEIDDNLIEVPPEIPGLDYLRRPGIRAAIIDCITRSDVVRVYSEAMQQQLRSYNPDVRLVHGPLDWDLIPETPPARDPARIELVYATSRQQDGIGLMLVRPLQRILDAFPQARLTIWGPRIASLSERPQVRHLAFVRDYDRFFSRFAREGFDIGLAPLPDDPFHRCKSNNKFREYASCGVAGVYSKMPVYSQCVVDGETGLLAEENEEAWFAAIERLITNPDLRARIARSAMAFARSHYNQEVTDAEWLSCLQPLAGGRATQPRPVVTSHPTAPAPQPVSTVRRAADHGVELLSRVPRMLRTQGIRQTWVGARNHIAGVAQLAAWHVRRWRLEMQSGRTP